MRAYHTRTLPSLLLGLLMSTLHWPTGPTDAAVKTQVDEVLDELRASDQEWRQSDTEFRRLRQQKSMSEPAVAEYAEFVALLYRKMLENCQHFRTVGGDPDTLGFTCELPRQDASPGRELPQDPARVMTEREKKGSLEALLQQSLHAFDKKLYEQQDKLRTDGARQASGSSTGNRNAKADGGNDRSRASGTTNNRVGDTPSRTGESASPSADTRPPPRVADPGAGPGMERSAALRIPGTNAAGDSDDDVVARQLREAAEREQDLVMKEKLWEEYRKYKASKN